MCKCPVCCFDFTKKRRKKHKCNCRHIKWLELIDVLYEKQKHKQQSSSEWERSQRHDKYCWTLWQNFNVIASDKWAAASLYGILIQTSIVTKTTHELCFVFDFDRKKNQCYEFVVVVVVFVSECVCVYECVFSFEKIHNWSESISSGKRHRNTNDFYENIIPEIIIDQDHATHTTK